MTDGDALLRAICENPDDDTPRLIYADWLDEHGKPDYAEFIRVQCKAEVHDTIGLLQHDDPEFIELYERYQTLQKEADRFVPIALQPYTHGYLMRRGFVSQLRMSTNVFLRHIDPLEFRTLAPIRQYQFYDIHPRSADELAASEKLAAVSGFDFSRRCEISPDIMRTLLTSPHFKATEMNIIWLWIRYRLLQAIANALPPNLLQKASFALNSLGPNAARLLVRHPSFSGLKFLELSENPLGDRGAIEIARATRTNLKVLLLWACEIGDTGAKALLESSGLKNTIIDLRDNPITPSLFDTIQTEMHKRLAT